MNYICIHIITLVFVQSVRVCWVKKEKKHQQLWCMYVCVCVAAVVVVVCANVAKPNDQIY